MQVLGLFIQGKGVIKVKKIFVTFMKIYNMPFILAFHSCLFIIVYTALYMLKAKIPTSLFSGIDQFKNKGI